MALTDKAILQIKMMIQSGDLKPGDRLPPEQDLSQQLGLSRSSMREAVKALEAMRVLDVRRGDGTYVTSLEPGLLLEAMSFVLDFHESNAVLEVFAVRRILESAVVALAAQTASPRDVTELRELLATIDEETPIEELVEKDIAFHRRIAQVVGNAYLVSLLETVSGQTIRARVWRGITEDKAITRTVAEHAAIVDAIEKGDAELARSIMTLHVQGVEERLSTIAQNDDTAEDPDEEEDRAEDE